MRARCSFDTEPWWALAITGAAPSDRPDWAMISAGGGLSSSSSTPARSAAISLSREVSRSARRRLLAKTIVERWASTRSATCSSTWGQIDCALSALPGSPSSALSS